MGEEKRESTGLRDKVEKWLFSGNSPSAGSGQAGQGFEHLILEFWICLGFRISDLEFIRWHLELIQHAYAAIRDEANLICLSFPVRISPGGSGRSGS